MTLEGHRNVVYAIAFNNPYGDKVITGSFGEADSTLIAFGNKTCCRHLACSLFVHSHAFTRLGLSLPSWSAPRNSTFPVFNPTSTPALDKTCKLWSAENGDLHHTFRGHSTEIVCLSFNPQGTVVATGSMDNTARLWDVETGECLHTLLGHTAEVEFAHAGDGERERESKVEKQCSR